VFLVWEGLLLDEDWCLPRWWAPPQFFRAELSEEAVIFPPQRKRSAPWKIFLFFFLYLLSLCDPSQRSLGKVVALRLKSLTEIRGFQVGTLFFFLIIALFPVRGSRRSNRLREVPSFWTFSFIKDIPFMRFCFPRLGFRRCASGVSSLSWVLQFFGQSFCLRVRTDHFQAPLTGQGVLSVCVISFFHKRNWEKVSSSLPLFWPHICWWDSPPEIDQRSPPPPRFVFSPELHRILI